MLSGAGTLISWEVMKMSLKSLRQIIKTVKHFNDQVGTKTVVSSTEIGVTYVSSAYADTTFVKSS